MYATIISTCSIWHKRQVQTSPKKGQLIQTKKLPLLTLNATWHQGNTAGDANKHLDDNIWSFQIFDRSQLLSKPLGTISRNTSSTKLDALKRKKHQNAAKLWCLSVLWQGAVSHEVTSKLQLTPNMAHQLAPFFLFLFFFFSFFFVLLFMMIHVRSGGDGQWSL